MSDIFIEEQDSGLSWDDLPIEIAYPPMLKSSMAKTVEQSYAEHGMAPFVCSTLDDQMRSRFGLSGMLQSECMDMMKAYISAFHAGDINSRYQVMWNDSWMAMGEEAKEHMDQGGSLATTAHAKSAISIFVLDLKTRHYQIISMVYDIADDGGIEWRPDLSLSTDIAKLSGTPLEAQGLIESGLVASYELREKIRSGFNKAIEAAVEEAKAAGEYSEEADLRARVLTADAYSVTVVRDMARMAQEEMQREMGEEERVVFQVLLSPHLEDAVAALNEEMDN